MITDEDIDKARRAEEQRFFEEFDFDFQESITTVTISNLSFLVEMIEEAHKRRLPFMCGTAPRGWIFKTVTNGVFESKWTDPFMSRQQELG